jgi:hypothetical protein
MPWCSNEVRAAALQRAAAAFHADVRYAMRQFRAEQSPVAGSRPRSAAGLFSIFVALYAAATLQNRVPQKTKQQNHGFCFAKPCFLTSAWNAVAAPQTSLLHHDIPCRRTSYDGIECRCSGLRTTV